MPILITGSQTNLGKLIEGLLTRRASAAQREQALLALRAANPGLPKRIPKGTPIVVPPLRNARRNVSDVGALVGADPLSDVNAAVVALPVLLANDVKETRARAVAAKSELTAVAEAEELRLARITRLEVDAIAVTLSADVEAAEKSRERFDSAVAAWYQDLDVLREVLHRAG